MTKIEWTHCPDGKGGFRKGETLNYQVGCVEKSPACRNCYAANTAHLHAKSIKQHAGLTVVRSNGVHWNGEINRVPKILGYPLRWREPRGVFVGSMTDTFLRVETEDDMRWIAALFGVMAVTEQHTYMLLTKRPANERRWFQWAERSANAGDSSDTALSNKVWRLIGRCAADLVGQEEWTKAIRAAKLRLGGPGVSAWPLPNVWLGVTAEDQQRADENIPELLRCPAAIHYVSYEPACGAVDFTSLPANLEAVDGTSPPWDWFDALTGAGIGLEDDRSAPGLFPKLDWLIAGGESGPKARIHHPAWFRSARDQCLAAGTAYFFKQHGEWGEVASGDDRWTHMVDLDGKAYARGDEMPVGKIASMAFMRKIGKAEAGRELDGETWSQFPEVPQP